MYSYQRLNAQRSRLRAHVNGQCTLAQWQNQQLWKGVEGGCTGLCAGAGAGGAGAGGTGAGAGGAGAGVGTNTGKRLFPRQNCLVQKPI